MAPVAFQLLAHPDGEAGMARAAAGAGTVMCVSSLTSTRPAEVAEAAPGGRRWMQVYLFRDRGVTRAMVEEAAEAGYEALLLTVDAPFAGRRERDLRTGFQVPAEIRAPAIEGAVGHKSLTTAEVFDLVDPSITWYDLEQLCGEFDLPILVKGLITGDDAALAVEHGAAGVVVSNHGGRQLDNAPATIDALPEVVEAVAGRIPVLVDGGIRRGTDVAVALAIGAEAVLVGRARPLGPRCGRRGRRPPGSRDARRRAAPGAGAARRAEPGRSFRGSGSAARVAPVRLARRWPPAVQPASPDPTCPT